MAALAAQGAKALEARDFPKAITLYTSAIAQHPTAVDYYIKRSTAYQRLEPPSNELALHDAEYGVSLGHKRGNKELIAQAQMRRGIALFRSGRVAEASKIFGFVRKRGGSWQKGAENVEGGKYGRPGIKGVTGLETWEIKVKKSLEGKEEADIEVLENPDVNAPPEKTEASKSTSTASHTGDKVTSSPPKLATIQTPASQIRHEWYQTSTDIVVTLFAKGVPKEQTAIEIQERSVGVSPGRVQLFKSTNIPFDIHQLSHSQFRKQLRLPSRTSFT
jgi:suppressor of G2 allele of SKP1